MSYEDILARLGVDRHYYCDTGPNVGKEHVTLSGYVTQEQYAELNNVINTWWKVALYQHELENMQDQAKKRTAQEG